MSLSASSYLLYLIPTHQPTSLQACSLYQMSMRRQGSPRTSTCRASCDVTGVAEDSPRGLQSFIHSNSRSRGVVFGRPSAWLPIFKQDTYLKSHPMTIGYFFVFPRIDDELVFKSCCRKKLEMSATASARMGILDRCPRDIASPDFKYTLVRIAVKERLGLWL